MWSVCISWGGGGGGQTYSLRSRAVELVGSRVLCRNVPIRYQGALGSTTEEDQVPFFWTFIAVRVGTDFSGPGGFGANGQTVLSTCVPADGGDAMFCFLDNR